MTETNTTLFPPGRYGRRRDGRKSRLVPAILAVMTVMALLGVSYKLYRQYGHEEYSSILTAYRDATDTQVVIEFTVFKPTGQTAHCVVRARDRAGAVVGRAKIAVTDPAERVEMVYTLTTSATPFSAETMGCSQGH